MVFIPSGAHKGTVRSHQEYPDALLTLTGDEYVKITFARLHAVLCDLLRDEASRVVAEIHTPDGRHVVRDDGSVDPA